MTQEKNRRMPYRALSQILDQCGGFSKLFNTLLARVSIATPTIFFYTVDCYDSSGHTLGMSRDKIIEWILFILRNNFVISLARRTLHYQASPVVDIGILFSHRRHNVNVANEWPRQIKLCQSVKFQGCM